MPLYSTGPDFRACYSAVAVFSVFRRDAAYFAEEAERLEGLNPERLRAITLAKFRRLLWHCLLRVPRYAERLPREIAAHEIEELSDPARIALTTLAERESDLQGFTARVEADMPPLEETEARRSALGLRSAALGGPRASWWSLPELGVVAAPCKQARHGELHIHAHHFLVEVDERGEVLVTDLHEYARPFLRVAVGMRGTLVDAPCRCGSNLPRIAR